MEAVRANPETTKTPALAATRTPKSPHQVTADSIEDLLPFLDAVARRGPVSGGLHAVWDLQPGQAALMRSRRHHQVAVVVWKLVHHRQSLRFPADDQVLTVVVGRGLEGPAEEAAGFLRRPDVGHAPGRVEVAHGFRR